MAFIETVAPERADGAVAEIYRRQESSWGFVPNYAKVFSHRPEVMARWGQLLAEIKRPMDKRRFELVTFAAAHELRHTPCTLAHGHALREFFSDEQIVAIAADRLTGVLDEPERAMLRFARQVARDASNVTSGQIVELEALGFTAKCSTWLRPPQGGRSSRRSSTRSGSSRSRRSWQATRLFADR